MMALVEAGREESIRLALEGLLFFATLGGVTALIVWGVLRYILVHPSGRER